MVKLLPRFIPSLIFWGVFTFVVFQIPYPDSITQANITKLLAFFMPLYLALTFTFNILLKNTLISLSISLGLIFLLALKALDSLNLVTGVLIIISIGLLISYFKKIKRRSLTNLPKIHKLTKLRNQNE